MIAKRSEPVSIPIRLVVKQSPAANVTRKTEPVSFGLPLPRGLIEDVSELALYGPEGRSPLQSKVLDRWPGGSIRWVLVDFLADLEDKEPKYEIRVGPQADAPGPALLLASQSTQGVIVKTGLATFRIAPGGAFPFQAKGGDQFELLDVARTGLLASGPAGENWTLSTDRVALEEPGIIRTVVGIHGWITCEQDRRLEVFVRLHFFANSATVKVVLTVRNSRRATHPSGLWDLGDPGSVLIRDLGLKLTLQGAGPSQTIWLAEPSSCEQQTEGHFELYQDSSGGENWRSANHVNREHRIPLAFRGYRVRSNETESFGLRATPTVILKRGEREVSLAVPSFWENFPKAIESDGESLTLSLFPRQFSDLHEIQGGEQKTHAFFVGLGSDRVGDRALAWCMSPLVASASPEWNCSSGAVPYLIPAAENPNRSYLALQEAAIEGSDTFEAKREIIDEYGWRHFGDIYGDHETVFGPPRETPLVSHYNNQYDPVAGFVYQFLSTGDPRWHAAMTELAAHVVDIDIYHTTDDKAAYNHGLFWHTYHYVDADTATHRSYPTAARAIVHGGGPSAEQNYASGLMHHYFLTGNEDSRQTALDLAQFVIDIDDGRKSVFRWIDRGATGLATASGSATYHGPGRASANSLNVLLDGHRLSGDKRFLEKAEEIIRRSIHPRDDIESRQLLDVERKWFYTMFLQSLGKYLDYKIDGAELDQMYGYGRESLLHYARWMAKQERPYLDKPEILQYPTETWAAQDMRKSDVFKYAAKHASGMERDAFLERSTFFFQYSVITLKSMPTRTFCRPVVVLLGSGMMDAAFQKNPAIAGPPPKSSVADFGTPKPFTPQRMRAMRRLLTMVAAGAIFVIVAIVVLIVALWR